MSPKPTATELRDGIPTFLDQLGVALQIAKATDVVDHALIKESGRHHGLDLLRMGLTIGQVVHDYGDVCQVVTELAVEQNAPISGEEFRTFNLCLDDAIAGAVTAFADERETLIAHQGNERLGVLAHELRNLLNIATLSFDAIKSGRVAVGGSTAIVHSRSLLRLRDLIDRSLAVVRLDAGIEHSERISVADFLQEIEIGARMQAEVHEKHLDVTSIDPAISIEGDRQILAAAVANLLDNAFKFTHKDGTVALTAHATTDRVLFDVADECGGLPPGKIETLFRPFEPRSDVRSGLGLGLSICLKAAHANRGAMHVRDIPGKGCVFTLDLPKV